MEKSILIRQKIDSKNSQLNQNQEQAENDNVFDLAQASQIIDDNEEIQINSVKELMSIFGVQMASEEKFSYNGKNYNINFNQIFMNFESPMFRFNDSNRNSIISNPNIKLNRTSEISQLTDKTSNSAQRRKQQENNQSKPDEDFYRVAQNTSERLIQSTLLPQPKNKRKVSSNTVKIHLAYLFSSPLVLWTSEENYYDVVPPIGFKEEFEGIIEGIESLGIKFRYKYQMATEQHLKECLNLKPIGLHFSGHGLVNQSTSFERDIKAFSRNKNKGDFLLFEQKNGSSINMYEENLKQILQDTYQNHKLKFVVVASCYSYCCGQIFAKSGIEHVICVDKSKAILDESAILFSRTFYTTVYSSDVSICKAFQSACKVIENVFKKAEADKFKLIIPDGHVCPDTNPIYHEMEYGEIEYFGTWPKIFKIPSRVEPFLFRNKDLFDIIRLLQQDGVKVVQIFAMPGLGKSSLIRNVTNYIAERSIYKDGILYLNVSKVENLKEIILQLITQLEYKNEDLTINQTRSIIEENESETEQVLFNILSKFKHKLLIVLDGIEIHKTQSKECAELLNKINRDYPKVQFLLSSCYFIEGIENFKVKKLNCFTPEQSYELFLQKFPYKDLFEGLKDMKQIKELEEYTFDLVNLEGKIDNYDMFENIPCEIRHTHKDICVKSYLMKHPLFLMMDGHPQSISMMAPLLVNKTLKQMFELLINSKLFVMPDSLNGQNNLIQSLEFSFSYLQGKDCKCIDIFFLIGTSYDGITEDIILEIMELSQEPILETKGRLSLLTHHSLIYLDQGDQKYKTPLFLEKYIDSKIDFDSKMQLNEMIANIYNLKINSLLGDKKHRDKEFQKSLNEFMLKNEKEILYCIDLLFKQRPNTQNSQLISQPLINKEMVACQRANHSEFTSSAKIGKLNSQSNRMSCPIRVQSSKIEQENKVERKQQSLITDINKSNIIEKDESENSQSSSSSSSSSSSDGRQINKTDSDSDSEDEKPTIDWRGQATDSEDETDDIVMINNIKPQELQKFNSHYREDQQVKVDNYITNIDEEASIIHTSIESWITSNNQEDASQSFQEQMQMLEQKKIDVQKEDKFEEIDHFNYEATLDKLKFLRRQTITKSTYNQFMNSVANPMVSISRLPRKGSETILNITTAIEEKIKDQCNAITLNSIELLMLNYLKLFALNEERKYSQLSEKIEKYLGKSQSELLHANLQMINVYSLIKNGGFIEASTLLLTLQNIFDKFNYVKGQGIIAYFRAFTLLSNKNVNLISIQSFYRHCLQEQLYSMLLNHKNPSKSSIFKKELKSQNP
eukprot:403376838